MSECKPRKVEHLAHIEDPKGTRSISIAICEDTSADGKPLRYLVATHHAHQTGKCTEKCTEIMSIRLPGTGRLVVGPTNSTEQG